MGVVSQTEYPNKLGPSKADFYRILELYRKGDYPEAEKLTLLVTEGSQHFHTGGKY